MSDHGRSEEERERARLEREAKRSGKKPPPAPPQPRPQAASAQPPSGAPAPLPPPTAKTRRTPGALDSAKRVLAARREHPGGVGLGGGGGPGGRLGLYALLGALVAAVILVFVLLYQPGHGPGGAEVQVTVPEGASVGDIGGVLKENGVIDSPFLFQVRATLDGTRGALRPGSYALRQDMAFGDALQALSAPPPPAPKKDTPIEVVIPEGKARSEIASIAADAGLKGDYMKATESFKGFDPKKYGAKDAKDLEGFLFPATYELKAGESVDALVAQQLRAFKDNMAGVDLKDAKKVNLTPFDVLTIASMVEREAVLDKERPIIASVIYNRLHDGINLGIDATIRFANDNWAKPLTQSELEIDSPYNTRTNAGLPPGPIGNPGLASIEAAAKPDKTKYLFYVVKPGTCGEHAFSETDADFQQDVEEYNSARDAKGGNSPTTC